MLDEPPVWVAKLAFTGGRYMIVIDELPDGTPRNPLFVGPDDGLFFEYLSFIGKLSAEASDEPPAPRKLKAV
jgi:hypothetical protein